MDFIDQIYQIFCLVKRSREEFHDFGKIHWTEMMPYFPHLNKQGTIKKIKDYYHRIKDFFKKDLEGIGMYVIENYSEIKKSGFKTAKKLQTLRKLAKDNGYLNKDYSVFSQHSPLKRKRILRSDTRNSDESEWELSNTPHYSNFHIKTEEDSARQFPTKITQCQEKSSFIFSQDSSETQSIGGYLKKETDEIEKKVDISNFGNQYLPSTLSLPNQFLGNSNDDFEIETLPKKCKCMIDLNAIILEKSNDSKLSGERMISKSISKISKEADLNLFTENMKFLDAYLQLSNLTLDKVQFYLDANSHVTKKVNLI